MTTKETFKPVREYKFKKETSNNKQVQFVMPGSKWIEFAQKCERVGITPSQKLREDIDIFLLEDINISLKQSF